MARARRRSGPGVYRARPVDGAEEPLRLDERPRQRIRSIARTQQPHQRRRHTLRGCTARHDARRASKAQRRHGHRHVLAGLDAAADDHTYRRRAGSCHRQPALAGRGQGDDGICAAYGRPQGNGERDEDAPYRKIRRLFGGASRESHAHTHECGSHHHDSAAAV